MSISARFEMTQDIHIIGGGLAGSEAAMGAWIGDVTPESQAERLRAALDTVPEVTA